MLLCSLLWKVVILQRNRIFNSLIFLSYRLDWIYKIKHRSHFTKSKIKLSVALTKHLVVRFSLPWFSSFSSSSRSFWLFRGLLLNPNIWFIMMILMIFIYDKLSTGTAINSVRSSLKGIFYYGKASKRNLHSKTDKPGTLIVKMRLKTH